MKPEDNHGSVVSDVAKDKDKDGTDTGTDTGTGTGGTGTGGTGTGTGTGGTGTGDIVCDDEHTFIIANDGVIVIDGGTVKVTKFTDFGTETFVYQDINSDGKLDRVSELWTVTNDVELEKVPFHQESLVYTGTEGDDLIAVRSGITAFGGEGNDTFVVREGGNLVFSDFNQGDQIHVDTAIGLTSYEHLVSFITNSYYEAGNFVVEFGDAATVVFEDLEVGVLGVHDVFVYS